MKAPRNINLAAHQRMLDHALPLLTPEAQRFFDTVCVLVTDSKGGGRANWRHSVARVPSWVFRDSVNFCGRTVIEGGDKFCAYYLAHEMAHLAARESGHGAAFMAKFKRFCPLELRWYETIYKPKLAAANGIQERV